MTTPAMELTETDLRDEILWCLRRIKVDDYRDLVATIDDIIAALRGRAAGRVDRQTLVDVIADAQRNGKVAGGIADAVLALLSAQPGASEVAGWQPISTIPDCDDLLWFCRGDTFGGPHGPLGDEADYWDWWCYAKPPSLPQPDAKGERPVVTKDHLFTIIQRCRQERKGGAETALEIVNGCDGGVISAQPRAQSSATAETPTEWENIELRQLCESEASPHEIAKTILDAGFRKSQPRAQEVGQWRSVETMPRDEAVLIGGGTIKYPIVCSWSGLDDEPIMLDYEGHTLDDVNGMPTHWLPLPSPPIPQPRAGDLAHIDRECAGNPETCWKEMFCDHPRCPNPPQPGAKGER